MLLTYARLVLAGLLWVSTGAKCRDIVSFRSSVRALTGFSDRLVRLVVPALLLLEATMFVLVLLPSAATILSTFVLAAVMFAVYTAVLARAVLTGASVDCNCFGATGFTVGLPELLRNTLLLSGCVIAAVLSAGRSRTLVMSADTVGLVGLAVATVIVSASYRVVFGVLRRPLRR